MAPPPHSPRDALDRGLHCGDDALGWLNPRQAGLAQVFWLGQGTERIDRALAIPGNELAVAPPATLQVNNVGGVAEGAAALGDRLALPGQATMRLAGGFHLPRAPLRARCPLWGTAWAPLCRFVVSVVEALRPIRIKLSVNNLCKFDEFGVFAQTLSQYLCRRSSSSHRLGSQTFRSGTGPCEKAAECELGLKDRLHPPIGQGLAMPHEFQHAQFPFFLYPQRRTHVRAEGVIEENEEHAAIQRT